MTRRVLVTGANKGIGLAVVEALLAHHADTHVLLGARSVAAGEAARSALTAKSPEWAPRLSVIQLDVTSPASVAAAAETVAAGGNLFGLVANAGIASGLPADIIDVNVHGVARSVEAFKAVLGAQGRLAIVSSGVAPRFVAKCSPARQAWFLAAHPAAEIFAAGDEFLAALAAASSDGGAALAAVGFPSPPEPMAAYGASKALLNAYTLHLAASTELEVNACSPGFIATDLTKGFFAGKTPEEAGALPPSASTAVVEHLLFGAQSRGWYYGSDAKRSE